jgi:excisionase family DNA binding protein
MDSITTTISEFSKLSGLGRSTVYLMLSSGELEGIRVGGRRLIVIDSWRRFVAAAPRDLGPQPMTPSAPPETAPSRRRAAPAAAR